MMLIADSGSTKTDWIFEGHDGILNIHTAGLNPVRDSEDVILSVLQEVKEKTGETESVYFYGAGCIEPFSETMRRCLRSTFGAETVEVHSDLLGAARALCGKDEGIACILGTGSNSCYCKDGEIVSNVPPLGYILGDEGSGASLGKHLLGDLLKGQMDHYLLDELMERYDVKYSDIIDRVYRQPQANRFLASLTYFLAEHREHPQVHKLLVNEFRNFLRRNVMMYNRNGVQVHFIGSVSVHFETELTEALELEKLRKGSILASPAEKILNYHRNML